MTFKSLPLKQLDATLAPWRAVRSPPPIGGWIHAVRQALGMTARQLAKSVGVTQPTVADAERTEARGDIALKTLRRYAAALDCELVYALVPLKSLESTVDARAERIARDQIARVRHSMQLEQQGTSEELLDHQVEDLKRKLLEGRRSRLWL
jgi:predicted DNA-binding mobile mystery protein A